MEAVSALKQIANLKGRAAEEAKSALARLKKRRGGQAAGLPLVLAGQRPAPRLRARRWQLSTCPKRRQGSPTTHSMLGSAPVAASTRWPRCDSVRPRNRTGKRFFIAVGFVASFAAGRGNGLLLSSPEAATTSRSRTGTAIGISRGSTHPRRANSTPVEAADARQPASERRHKEPASPPPMPVAVEVLKREPRPLGVVMKVNPAKSPQCGTSIILTTPPRFRTCAPTTTLF